MIIDGLVPVCFSTPVCMILAFSCSCQVFTCLCLSLSPLSPSDSVSEQNVMFSHLFIHALIC